MRFYLFFYQMKMKTSYLIVFILTIMAVIGQNNLDVEAAAHPEAKLSFVDYCNYFKYPVQTHQVQTQDGYLLTIFRIQKKATTIKYGLKPVFFQHGLLDSSDGWIINDDYRAPALLMADRGYDVWLGNNRGNKYSRKHIKYNPDKDKQFWQFSFQHMADFDLPACFKYVNGITGQKIHYIGHSQGTIQMQVALSKRNPTVEQLMDKYFAFGPVAFVANTKSNLITLLNKSLLLQWYTLRGINQFMPSSNWFNTDMGIAFCATFNKICGDMISQIMDGDSSLDNYDRYDVLVGHYPAGTSTMNMAHWKQLMDKKRFESYDYGSSKANQEHYGQPFPPPFELSQIRVPVRLFAGASDLLADLTDVQYLWKSLNQNVKAFYKIYNAGHLTFLQGLDISPWMNDVFTMMNQSQEQQQAHSIKQSFKSIFHKKIEAKQ